MSTNEPPLFADETPEENLFVDDGIVFAEEEPLFTQQLSGSWKVLIVDDEAEIHSVTKMALEDLTFDQKNIHYISAFSGAEAREKINEHKDIAVILLDVVMEENDAGLQVAKFIREEAMNSQVRIILRTGQPGQAPEKMVIRDYDINDYKTKTELTSQKLATTMYSALRSYRDIMSINTNKRVLERLIKVSSSMFELQITKDQFIASILNNLISILNTSNNVELTNISSFMAIHEDDKYTIVAGTGKYELEKIRKQANPITDDLYFTMDLVYKEKKNLYTNGDCLLFVPSKRGHDAMVYVEEAHFFDHVDHQYLDIFSTNLSVALDNIYLNEEIKYTEQQVVYAMGTIAETRSKETGNHVKRVAEYSKFIALKLNLSLEEAELIKQASPLHDLGKLGIPDAVLNKPGKHTPEEWQIMKTHAQLGHDMLKGSDTEVLRSGAIIAKEHHEKWNGKGYPNGLKGEEIHLYGRITAVADVFDALGSDRCYKKAWELDRILDLFKEERGEHFDPEIVDILLNNIDEIIKIRDAYKDLYEGDAH